MLQEDSVHFYARGPHHVAIPVEIGFDPVARLVLGHLPNQLDAGSVYLLSHARILEHLVERITQQSGC